MSLEAGKKRARRLGLVLLGIVAGQLILYGASFIGTKVLLPLDILAQPGTYIPLAPGQKAQPAHNDNASDPVLEDEPARLFRNSELRAGRLPIWNPYQYAGVPNVSFLSPFAIFGALVRSPRILPWLSLMIALVSGFGVYVFSRRVLQVGVWPATIAAWCYPVTGFFVLWQSYSLAHPIVWLPWLLYAIHSVLLGSSRWALPGLATVAMLTIVSGHLDMAGLVVIVGGLFAIWESFFVFHRRDDTRESVRRFAIVIAGWALGFMLASPELLPALEYAKTGSRLSQREAGREERPPIGLASLPQLVLPHIYGTIEKNGVAIFPKKESDLPETPAAGFTGLVASLVLAPLAWGSRRHRSVTWFLAAIAFLGIAWCLNVPGIVWLMRLPALNLLSYNRFVFVSSFALLLLATIGLEGISNRTADWHRWYYIPVAILAGLSAWCVFRAFSLPEAIAVKLPQVVAAGHPVRWVEDMEGVRRVQHWFTSMYTLGAIVCFAAIGVWLWVRLKRNLARSVPALLGLLAFGELLFFDYGRAAQCDPQLYYPRIAALEEIGRSLPGRVVGYKCLPANLLQTQKLLDVRGYDGVDPARMVDLLTLAAAPESIRLDYAAVQLFIPRVAEASSPNRVQLSPILDLLGVRYVVFLPPEGTDYSVAVNDSALPRVFVPRSVEVESDAKTRLAKLGSPLFNPREVAYVEEPAAVAAPVQGEAKIVEVTPQSIAVSAKMPQRGLVVLADQWNSGWRAYVANQVVPILHVDHALRGVIVPPGESTIVFRYQPTSLRLGLGAAAVAILILLAYLASGYRILFHPDHGQ